MSRPDGRSLPPGRASDARTIGPAAADSHGGLGHALLRSLPSTSVLIFDGNLRCRLAGGGDAALALGFSAVGTVDPLLADMPSLRDTRILAACRAALDGAVCSYRLAIGERTFDLRIGPLDEGGHAVRHGILMAQELTHVAHQRLDRWFRRIVDLFPNAILIVRRGTSIYGNAAAAGLLGHSTAALLAGRPLDALLRPATPGAVEIPAAEPAGGPPRTFSRKYLRQDGLALEIEVTSLPVDFEGGPATLLALSDVTASRQAAENSRESSSLWRNIIDTMDNAVITTTSGGTVTSFNRAAENQLGYRADEIIGRVDPTLFHERGELEARAALAIRKGNVAPATRFDALVATARRGVRDESDWNLVRRDGEKVPARLLITALTDWQGQVNGFLIVGSLLGERSPVENELRRAKESAERAMRSRSDFLARMSHEIRTPMNGVLGMVDLALQTKLSPVQRDYLETAQSSAHDLLTIINDILDFSKIDAGKLRLDNESFRPAECFGAALRGLSSLAFKKGLELLLDLDPNVPSGLCGDSQRLRQIVTNLVGNAIKFTDRGEVTVSVGLHSRSRESVELQVEVADTGIGIPPEKQSLIFEAFSQAEETTTRRFGGTGLGLAICAQLVELMSGRIWVTSELGRGSRFFFRVPLAVDESVPAKSPGSAALQGLRALVVDDHQGQRAILSAMLESWGVRAVASAGPTALDVARRAQSSGTPFEVLLLDTELPGIDSMALARQVRAVAAPEVALVLLGNAGQGSAPEDEGAWGAHAFIAKPVLASLLLESVEALLGGGSFTAWREARSKTGVHAAILQRLTVLVADDNAVNRKVVSAMLEKVGHQVDAVEDGRKAVAAVTQKAYDLVLMDVEMPEMNGLDAARTIRASESGTRRRLPIIALTAQAMKGDQDRCLAAGMDAYVTKPVNREELLRTMARITTNPDDTHVPRADEGPKPLPAPALQAAPFSREELLERLDGDTELMAEILGLFRRDLPAILNNVRAGVRGGDARQLERAAHAIKGSLLNIAAHPASIPAKELEDAGRANSLEQVGQHLKRLEKELERLLPVILQNGG